MALDDVYRSRARQSSGFDLGSMMDQINNQMNQIQNEINRYSNPASSGSWTAVGNNQWKYTDRFGNTTYDTGTRDNNWNGIDSQWDGSKWIGNTDLVDANSMLNDLNNAYNNLAMQNMMLQSMYNQQQQYSQMQSALEEQYAAQQAAAEARINANIDAINAKRPEYQQQAENAAQQAYINKMLAEKSLGEKMAASGLSGTGATESAAIRNENNYGNSVNSAISERDNALRGLDNQITNVRAGGDATLSELDAAYQSNLLNLLQNQQNAEWSMAQNYVEMMNQLNQQDIANKFQQAQFDYAKEQDALDRLAAQQAAAAKAYSSSGSSSGSGSSSSSGKPRYTLDGVTKVVNAAKNDDQVLSDDVIEAYRYWYGYDPVLYNENNVAQGLKFINAERNKNPDVTWSDELLSGYIKQLALVNGYSNNDQIEIMKRLNM